MNINQRIKTTAGRSSAPAAVAFTIFCWCFTVGVFADQGAVNGAHLPTDAKATCTADVANWFPNHEITANGWVTPADGLKPIFADFQNNTRCDFYRWGAQMFLWLTSGAGTKHVFNTPPVFYDISVAEDGKRHFLSETGPMKLAVRKSKTDEEIELGQAGGGDVLLSQNQSLVYYGLHANNVYALYTTGRKNNDSSLPDHFPSTSDEIDSVNTYAVEQGYPLTDTEAMALELKTSWADAATVRDRSDYVLTQAIVPVFDRAAKDPTTGKQQWTITGNQPKTLALVGMHVVGTVNGHPEMVWATFEHVDNVPDATYQYTNMDGDPATWPYDASGTWNFLPSNATEPTSIAANAQVSTYTGSGAECVRKDSQDDNTECIVNVNGAEIAPIDVIRPNPWGDDQSDSSSVANNTDLVSINVSVLSQLQAGDIRSNYIQTGSIWTAKGQIPPGFPDTDPDYLRGSTHLANSTMETFFQFHNKGENAFNPQNCFGCHGSTESDATGISHIYDELQPLPKK
ncbi:MAG: hypothetical protein WD397_08405 [Wenzhouxiangellaceae bacterium]